MAFEADHAPMTDHAGHPEPRPDPSNADGDHDGDEPASEQSDLRLIDVYAQGGPEGYDGTCLRPLGLCELGGCCDACWYNSNRGDDSIGERPEASTNSSATAAPTEAEPAKSS